MGCLQESCTVTTSPCRSAEGCDVHAVHDACDLWLLPSQACARCRRTSHAVQPGSLQVQEGAFMVCGVPVWVERLSSQCTGSRCRLQGTPKSTPLTPCATLGVWPCGTAGLTSRLLPSSGMRAACPALACLSPRLPGHPRKLPPRMSDALAGIQETASRGFEVQDSGLRVWGSGFGVWGWGSAADRRTWQRRGPLVWALRCRWWARCSSCPWDLVRV